VVLKTSSRPTLRDRGQDQDRQCRDQDQGQDRKKIGLERSRDQDRKDCKIPANLAAGLVLNIVRLR